MLLCISFYNLCPLTWLIYKALWTIIDCWGTSDCYPITSNPTQWLDTRTRYYCTVDVTSNPIQWLATSNHNYLPVVYTSSWTYDRTLALITVCPVKSLIIRHNDWTLVLVTVAQEVTNNSTQWPDTSTRNCCPVGVTNNATQWPDTSTRNCCLVKSLIIRHNDRTLVLVTVAR